MWTVMKHPPHTGYRNRETRRLHVLDQMQRETSRISNLHDAHAHLLSSSTLLSAPSSLPIQLHRSVLTAHPHSGAHGVPARLVPAPHPAPSPCHHARLSYPRSPRGWGQGHRRALSCAGCDGLGRPLHGGVRGAGAQCKAADRRPHQPQPNRRRIPSQSRPTWGSMSSTLVVSIFPSNAYILTKGKRLFGDRHYSRVYQLFFVAKTTSVIF